MIEVIIILLIILGSLVGAIFFGIHYFHNKHKIKERKINERIDKILKEAKVKKNKKNIKITQDNLDLFDGFDWWTHKLTRALPFLIFMSVVLVIINITFNPFSNQTQQSQVTSTPNERAIADAVWNQNGSITEVFKSMTPQGAPWWLTPLLFLIPFWMVWRIFIRSSSL
jgi:hypothetical protein